MNKLQIAFIIFLSFFFFYKNSLAQEQKKDGHNNIKGESHFEAGIIFGSPAGFNAITGYWFRMVGLHLSGIYSNKYTNGIQFNLGYKLSENAKTRHNFGIAIGKSQDRGCDYSYLGPVYDLNYRRLFLEIGVGKVIKYRRGDFSSLPYWIIFQIGYMHRFQEKR